MAKDWAKAFYKSRGWHISRRMALRRDHYTCHDCEGRADEVHHIVELTRSNIRDPMVALNLDNLMSLCRACHQRRTFERNTDVGDGLVFDADGFVVQREA